MCVGGGVKTVGHLKSDVDIKFKVLHAGIGPKSWQSQI